jgi:Holliday junction resolvasome RuvABC endonuclease subunit
MPISALVHGEDMKMNVIGVDPALRNFGIVSAILDTDTLKFEITSMRLVQSEDNAKQAKTVRKNSDDIRRARLLHYGFIEACQGASFAFVEVPVGSQSSRAMASYGICVGILAACPIAMIQVTASEVKLAGTGIKTATKDEMIEAAVAAHPDAGWLTRKSKGSLVLMNDNEHLADAVFCIQAGIQTDQFQQAVALYRGMKAA